MITAAPVVHTDDTGWRVGGESAFLMAFETEAATVYQVWPRHRHEEVQEVIPADYIGVMVTDRGRSYDAQAFDDVRQQKCLAHVQRSLSEVLAAKTGRRLRRVKYSAQGVHVSCVYIDMTWWHTGRKFDVPIYTTRDIYIKALRLLNMSGYKKRVRNLAVSVYELIPSTSEQLELFASPTHAVSEASDKINDRWGEFVITPALMMGMDDIILDRISFGGVKELQEIYE
jgi:Transposase IS66 family/impB/mucB/samB family C-terminal domain